MVNDIASGQIDAGVLWGPIAGYYAQHATPRLVVVPLLKEHVADGFSASPWVCGTATRTGSASSTG